MSFSRTQKIRDAYRHMMNRCYDTENPRYDNCGGRGIHVCPAWRADILAFTADVGLPPSKDHSLDRIDNDGHYEPSNVRWATRIEQANNKQVHRGGHRAKLAGLLVDSARL